MKRLPIGTILVDKKERYSRRIVGHQWWGGYFTEYVDDPSCRFTTSQAVINAYVLAGHWRIQLPLNEILKVYE